MNIIKKKIIIKIKKGIYIILNNILEYCEPKDEDQENELKQRNENINPRYIEQS
jgi:hypothetical protein